MLFAGRRRLPGRHWGSPAGEVRPVSVIWFIDDDACLDNCCVSVPTPDGNLVPFCGYNMTTDDGEYAMCNRNDWGGGPAANEPVDAELSADDD